MHYIIYFPASVSPGPPGKGMGACSACLTLPSPPPTPTDSLPPATTLQIPKVCGIIELEPLVKDQGQ